MDNATLNALKGSIKKWEKIVAGTGADKGMDNCPLCKRFAVGKGDDEECVGCPVYDATGQPFCDDSPLVGWSLATQGQPWLNRKAETAYQRAAAQAELDFLKSLLPKPRRAKAKP